MLLIKKYNPAELFSRTLIPVVSFNTWMQADYLNIAWKFDSCIISNCEPRALKFSANYDFFGEILVQLAKYTHPNSYSLALAIFN